MSALPSALKSPVAFACQVEPGLKATLAPETRLVPSTFHSATVPSLCCHRISDLPSPLKLPESITCQPAPGLKPTLAPLIRLVPFINQIPGVPSLFCHRTSLCPSPLKSCGGRKPGTVIVTPAGCEVER